MWWRIVHSGIMSAGMSAVVAFVVTVINTGLDADIVLRWLNAWALALPVAWLSAFLWGPTAKKIASLITRPPPGV